MDSRGASRPNLKAPFGRFTRNRSASTSPCAKRKIPSGRRVRSCRPLLFAHRQPQMLQVVAVHRQHVKDAGLDALSVLAKVERVDVRTRSLQGHPQARPFTRLRLQGPTLLATSSSSRGRPRTICSKRPPSSRSHRRAPLQRIAAGRWRWAKDPLIVDEQRALEARQAIDPYTKKTKTMTFNHCCFAARPNAHHSPAYKEPLHEPACQ